ncbi:MAG: hypothetical protein K2X81_20640 [Candidatus Obscuribacterales bacterium]|nr:hypothetical protein [Candidatus Obscuribacterales bacterium]
MRYSNTRIIAGFLMGSNLEENEPAETAVQAEEFFVPEFGRIDISWIDLSKKYRGAMFRLNPDAAKQLAEIAGFIANFDFPGIRAASIDFFKNEGHIVFEIERNTKPSDLSVRYSRERWSAQDQSKGDNLRPWLKTEYRAKLLSDKVIALIAEQLKIQTDAATHFVIRLNFKEKTFGLICEEKFAEKMPTGTFSPFSLPTESMIALATSNHSEYASAKAESKTESTTEPTETAITKDKTVELDLNKIRSENMEATPKYATYSKSEIDTMLKLQAENITSALGSKISSQQRVFQESAEKQEKVFAKLSDNFVAQFDQTRARLEKTSKDSEDIIKVELDTFKKELGKELENYRAQINKTVVPVAKFIDDKNSEQPKKAIKEQAAAASTKTQTQTHTDNYLKPLVLSNLILGIILLATIFGIVVPQLAKVEELSRQVNEIHDKLGARGTNSSATSTATISSPSSTAGNTTGASDAPVNTSGSGQ